MVNNENAQFALQIASGLWQFVDQLKAIKGTSVISAHFDGNGKYIEGNSSVKVIVHEKSPKSIWWFEVEPKDEYSFIRFPINDSGTEELIASTSEKSNPDTKYWRWVQKSRSGIIAGGNPPEEDNALVEFVVIGFKTGPLINHLSSEKTG